MRNTDELLVELLEMGFAQFQLHYAGVEPSTHFSILLNDLLDVPVVLINFLLFKQEHVFKSVGCPSVEVFYDPIDLVKMPVDSVHFL